MVQLTEIASVIRGVSFDKAETADERRDGYLPILRAGNLDGELLLDHDLVWVPEARVSADQRLQVGDIAICMSSGSLRVVGKTARLRHAWSGSVGAFCAIVRPKSGRVLPEYLTFFLQSEQFRSWTRQSAGANIKNIRKSELEEFPIHVPLLDEQRRIVDLLSRAEGIVRLRREAQKKAQAIIPALFLDMFGDPATNPKGLEVVALGDVLAEPPTLGTMAKPSATAGSWLDLRVANIQGGKLDLSDKKWLDLPADQVDRFSLRSGDILLARAIGSLDHLGKAVVVDPPEPWTFDSHLMRLRLRKSKMVPEFFKAFLESKSGREAFLKHTRRSAVQFNINGKEVRQISIPLPPLPLQTEFVERCRAVAAIFRLQASAADRAEATFQALLFRAFSAEIPACAAREEEGLLA